MRRFDASIEQLLWPEKRPRDSIFPEPGPGVGVIDRLTTDSYLEVATGYIPDYLRPLLGIARRWFPFIAGTASSVRIGPFPKGMPVGLITNMDLLGSDLPPQEQRAHRQNVLRLLVHAQRELRATKDLPTLLNSLTDDALAVSKCKDFVVNKGHYFGTQYFAEEPGLSDQDKAALIAFLKTL
jgi:hypothetical protein